MVEKCGPDPEDAAADPSAFFGLLARLLAGGERVVLCTLLRLEGSGPRRAGAKMLVRHDGIAVGTVGGGLLEARTIAWAQEALQSGRPLCRAFALDRAQASDEGMTCGGAVEVLIEPFEGDRSAARDFFDRVAAFLALGACGWLATALHWKGDGLTTDHWLVADERIVAPTGDTGRPLPQDLLQAATPAVPILAERGTEWYFLDPVVPAVSVYLFGGGHIGRHLAPLCRLMGFRTVVVDDRPEWASRDRFPQADELVAVQSFERAFETLPIGPESYIVIATRGHGGDLTVLRQALQRRPAYVGMIGSSRKRGLIFGQLAAEGLGPEDLARVACPVGLPIGAETPQEIAVSIAAQLIATRAARRGGA